MLDRNIGFALYEINYIRIDDFGNIIYTTEKWSTHGSQCLE